MADEPTSALDPNALMGPPDPNLAARQKAADEVRNQTVGVYDPRDNSTVQVPPDDAQKLQDLGYTVGDEAAERKSINNSLGAQLDVLAHATANTATFGAFDNIARVGGGAEYLKGEAERTRENPWAATAGTLIGGAATSELRGLSLANPLYSAGSLGLSAVESMSNAYNEAAALDQPITAEQLIHAGGMGMLYNGVFNAAGATAAKVFGGAAKGARALNDRYEIFPRSDVAGPKVRASEVGAADPGAGPGPVSGPAGDSGGLSDVGIKVAPVGGPDPVAPAAPGTPASSAAYAPPEPAAVEPEAGHTVPLTPQGTVHPHAVTMNADGQVEFGGHVDRKTALQLIDDQMRRLLGKKDYEEYVATAKKSWAESGGTNLGGGGPRNSNQPYRASSRARLLDSLHPPKEVDGVQYPGFEQLRKTRAAIKKMDSREFMEYLRQRQPGLKPNVAPEAGPAPQTAPAVKPVKVKPVKPKVAPTPENVGTLTDGELSYLENQERKKQGYNDPESPWIKEINRRRRAATGVSDPTVSEASPEEVAPEGSDYDHPAAGEPHPRISQIIDALKNDPEALKREFPEVEKNWHKALINLDKLEPGTPEYAHAEAVANQYHHVINQLQEAMAAHEPHIKPPPPPHRGSDLEWHYPEHFTEQQMKREVGAHYDRILGDDGLAMQAVYLRLKQEAIAAEKAGNMAEMARLRARATGVEKELHVNFPRSTHPETGETIPGWRDTQKEYTRLHGHDYVDPDTARFSTLSPEQKADYEAEQHLHKERPDLKFASADTADVPPEGNPFDKDVPGESAEAAKEGPPIGDTPPGTKSPKAGPSPRYKPRFTRWRLWRLSAISGPFRPLVHATIAANEFIPAMLNHVDPFVEAVNKAAQLSETQVGSAIRHALSAKVQHDAAVGPIDAQYNKIQKLVTHVQANPEVLEDGIRAQLGPGAQNYPNLTGNTVKAAATAITAVSQNMARNPNNITPRNSGFDPPRREKVRVIRMAQAVFDPASVIRDPDPDSWAVVQQVHPETAKYVRDALIAAVANPKIKLTRRQMHNLSILLGGPVSPQNDPEYIKSKHEAATMMAAPSPPGKTGGGGGAGGHPSAKLSQQVTTLQSTPDQQAQLGL